MKAETIPKVEWKATKKPGVVYLESTKGREKHRVYYIRYRHRGGVCPTGKRCTGHFEKASGTSTTPGTAAGEREDKIRGKAPTNEARREQEQAEKAAEAGKWTFDRLWTAWQTDPENAGKRGTKKTDQRYRKHIGPKFGDREPKALAPLDVDRLRLAIAKNHSRETTKSIIGLLTRLARYGASKGYCKGLPFPVILKGTKLGSDPRHKRAPNRTEQARFLVACRHWPNRQEAAFMLFIARTGVRRTSAQNLTWPDVNMENGTAILRGSKTGDVQIILSKKALALLRAHPVTPGVPFVFVGKNMAGELGTLTQKVIDRVPRKIADAAGWPKDLDPCHAWRRNLATRLNEGGHGTKTIMAAGAWASPTMVLHYISVEQKTVRDAVDGLGIRPAKTGATNGLKG